MKSTPICAKALLTAALCALTPAAMAGPMDRMLQKLDTDEDGQISMIEFQAREKSMVKRLDEDGDNAVSLDEMTTHIEDRKARVEERIADAEARLTEHFNEADANDDGLVTVEEANTSMFTRIDANADGYLTPEEIKDARPEGHRGRFGGRGHHGKFDSSDEV